MAQVVWQCRWHLSPPGSWVSPPLLPLQGAQQQRLHFNYQAHLVLLMGHRLGGSERADMPVFRPSLSLPACLQWDTPLNVVDWIGILLFMPGLSPLSITNSVHGRGPASCLNYVHLSPCGEASIQPQSLLTLPLRSSIHREVHTCFLHPSLSTLEKSSLSLFQW